MLPDIDKNDDNAKSSIPSDCGPTSGGTLRDRTNATRLIGEDMNEKTHSETANTLLGFVKHGSLVRGCLLSVIGAILGGVAWCIATLITQMEFMYLAVGIGIAAGVGMRYGCQKATALRGMMAAGVATGGILLGYYLILLYATMPSIDFEMRKCDPRVVRLASHYCEIEGMYREMRPQDEARYRLYNQRAEKLAELKDDELNRRIEELNAWENGGCNQDEEYVLHALAYYMIANDPTQIGYARDRIFLIPQQEWAAAFDAAMQKASVLSAEHRLNAIQDYREKNRRYERVAHIAFQRADARAIKEGLPFDDDRRTTFRDEELARLWSMSDSELKQATEAQAAWQQGKRWDDQKYLRNFVICDIVKQTMNDRIATKTSDATSEEGGSPSRISQQDWDKAWAVSAAELSGKDDQELRTMADEIERRQKKKEKELEERDNDASRLPSKSQHIASITPDILIQVVNNLGVFGYASILVAIVLAYSIGGVKSDQSQRDCPASR